jgi:hypothetical protein
MTKVNPALTPGVKFGNDIFGNEYDQPVISGPADELIFLRLGLGRDERKQRGAIWRGNQNEAAMLSKVVIDDQTESKLVHVEPEASILVANEDSDVMKTEVGGLSIQVETGPVGGRL